MVAGIAERSIARRYNWCAGGGDDSIDHDDDDCVKLSCNTLAVCAVVARVDLCGATCCGVFCVFVCVCLCLCLACENGAMNGSMSVMGLGAGTPQSNSKIPIIIVDERHRTWK